MYKSSPIAFNNFSTMTLDTTYQHEVGHAFGLDDEYAKEGTLRDCGNPAYSGLQSGDYKMCDELTTEVRSIYHYIAASRYVTKQSECQTDPDCKSGEYCDAGVDLTKNACRPLKADGAACALAGGGHQCVSGMCGVGRCYTPGSVAIGGTCYIDGACGKGKCSGVDGLPGSASARRIRIAGAERENVVQRRNRHRQEFRRGAQGRRSELRPGRRRASMPGRLLQVLALLYAGLGGHGRELLRRRRLQARQMQQRRRHEWDLRLQGGHGLRRRVVRRGPRHSTRATPSSRRAPTAGKWGRSATTTNARPANAPASPTTSASRETQRASTQSEARGEREAVRRRRARARLSARYQAFTAQRVDAERERPPEGGRSK